MTPTVQNVQQTVKPGVSGQMLPRIVTAAIWGALQGIVYFLVYAFVVRLATHASVSPAYWGTFWNEWVAVDAGLGAITFAGLSWAFRKSAASRRGLLWRGLLAGLICAVVLTAFTMAIVFSEQPYWSAPQGLAVLGLFARIVGVAVPAMSLLGLLSGLSW